MAHANSTCLEFAFSGVVCFGVFFNYKEVENSKVDRLGIQCNSTDNFDSDIAGIGVSKHSNQCTHMDV